MSSHSHHGHGSSDHHRHGSSDHHRHGFVQPQFPVYGEYRRGHHSSDSGFGRVLKAALGGGSSNHYSS